MKYKSAPFTQKEINWASRHDWFVSGNANEIVGLDEVWDCNVQPPVKLQSINKSFTSIGELRDWAGY